MQYGQLPSMPLIPHKGKHVTVRCNAILSLYTAVYYAHHVYIIHFSRAINKGSALHLHVSFCVYNKRYQDYISSYTTFLCTYYHSSVMNPHCLLPSFRMQHTNYILLHVRGLTWESAGTSPGARKTSVHPGMLTCSAPICSQ